LIHHASPDFWECYRALPATVRQLADQAFERLKSDPRYPALHFKKVGRFWSARVGDRHRQPLQGTIWTTRSPVKPLLLPDGDVLTSNNAVTFSG
jgi:hypothetical protein